MNPAIEIRGIRKRFRNIEALAGIDLSIEQGEFFGLLGPNGAGKTTLISILAGLARADHGSARIMGNDVCTHFRAARRSLGVVPQELVFDPFFTVRQTLRIQSGYFGLRRNDQWIEEILHHLDLTDKADTNMRALSGGMKRRVLIGQALVHKPPVIILDEPTAGVDVELRRSLWSFIRRLNKDGHTIVLTTHYLEEAEELCMRVAMLKAGRMVALDSTDNLVRRHQSSVLRLRFDGPVPHELAVRGVVSEGSRCTLPLQDVAELEPLLAQIRASGARILDVELLRPDLEDVFLRIISSESTA